MQKRILCYAVACLLSLNVFSQYIYEGNQSLIDLTNQSGTTNLNSGDDQVSNVFNLGFNFDFYNETFSSARMATNGCLHFKISGAYCNDYTPDPLANQYTYTMLPFWTDLIRDNGSKMLAKNFNDMTVFGWYNMREYNRASDNSFEVILWTNNTFEYRYGELDIINHDVLIGEVGSGSSEIYQYLFHDECNTGSTNSNSCVNTNWNDTSFNDMLENGGSLYGSGSGNNIDCSNPLNNSNCSGYAAAYQAQQCDIDQLYSESCPYYWDAYDDLQCDLDPQYAPFCQGYSQENSVAYFEEEFDYGYQEEYDMYDTFEDPEIFEEYVFEFEYDFFEEPELIFTEEIIFEQLQSLDEFIEPLPFIREEEVFLPVEDLMIEEFVFQETFIEEVEEWFEEEAIIEEELAYAEESEEELIEELIEEEEEVIEEEIQEEEELVVAEVTSEGKSSISREMALNIISSTLSTAQASVSGTTSGNSIHSTGGTTGASSVSSSNSGGVSISNSPSISEQFASSTAQNNQVLEMSSNITSSTSVETETVETMSVAVDTTSTQTLQNQIDVSVSTDSSATEVEQTVANIVAQNLQDAQEDFEAKQEETGEYGSENTIIAYMGFVPDFNKYRLVTLPDQEIWYEPKDIYANNILSDNIEGFYQMAGQSLETLIKIKELQPEL